MAKQSDHWRVKLLNKRAMTLTTAEFELQEYLKLKHATIFLVKGVADVAVVQATSTYIPIDQFKELFNSLEPCVRDHQLKKLVFDKRNLTVFHQPSMEWYFTDWKERMFDLGLKTHIKILPNDVVFRQSVKIGREKINLAHPNGKFHQMDIRYADSIEEAIAM